MVPEMKRVRSESLDERELSSYQDDYFDLTQEERDMPAATRPPQVNNVVMHPLKVNKHRKYLRVCSVENLPSLIKQSKELKPLTKSEVDRMKEMDLQVKLCDMGNACYIDKHYSDIIQTREYRSPEVILGGEYDESADIWSLACMIFELVTGDYLFDPKKGKTFRKNDDHLALITELIGPCYNTNWLQTNPKVWKFYNKKNMKLKNVTKLHHWRIYYVLLEKYRLKESEAQGLADFLECMLKWRPKDRQSARELQDHYWLHQPDDYGVWMSK